MRVTTDDLVRRFLGNGGAFEDFVHDLVRAVGRSCGIDPVNIDWDYRTNVKDGGRDLVVRMPNPRPEKQFIPPRKSVFSIKSGEEGVRPASLRAEILAKNHPKVRDALLAGWAYIWCTVHPADHDKRDDMREAADNVAAELGVDPHLIEFRWPEQLQGETNLYPGLIFLHLPDVASAFSKVLSLRQWGREPGMSQGWIDFGGRVDVVQRVAEHLLRQKPPNVLHIAGLSGIGKTRTVFEACKRTHELNGILYIERCEQVDRALYRYLEENGRYVHLVIDETTFEETEAIASRLGEFADRVRVVTIGPAMRQAVVSRDEVLILPEPDTDVGVLGVVRAAGTGLSEDVLRSIAEQSGHDLRLALLLVRATQQLPDLRGVPVVDIDGVWRRLMVLFRDRVGDPDRFRERYEILTASVDVGRAEDVGGEIGVLATFFEHPAEHVRAAADAAVDCGLGIGTRRFFEATPRALAARLFERCVWRRIRDRLDEFALALLGHSDRLARRFLERCQDCAGDVREEVMARLGDFFLKALADVDIAVLASRNASRLFQTWAEFDPRRGLSWLQKAVDRSSADQLLTLHGESDGTGGWAGRRQLVWLCQSLASFAEHFEACEAILYRFALHETEPSIGNNSTALWQSLFWPALAATEVPFNKRLPILLRRLQAAPANELPLTLAAAVGCVEPRQLGLPLPPGVVGGRVVPPRWRPKSWDELRTLRGEAARQILDVIAEMTDDRLQIALATVVKHLGVFTRLGLVDRLRSLLIPEGLDESLRSQLVWTLEKEISFVRDHHPEDALDSIVPSLEAWLAEFSPTDLAAGVRILTAQDFWSGVGLFPDKRAARYDRLADELIDTPETFRSLSDWFDRPEVRSAGALGFRLGRQDSAGRLAVIVREWLYVERCQSVTGGYLAGRADGDGELPAEWAAVLDDLSRERPEVAAAMTTAADFTARGFERVATLIERLPAPRSLFLRPLAAGPWLNLLRPEQRTRTLQILLDLAAAGDSEAIALGLDLIRMWAHVDPNALDQHLVPLALRFVSWPFGTDFHHDLHNWREVTRLLSKFYLREVAEVIVGQISDPSGRGRWANEENIEVLAKIAAADPSAVMQAVGNALLDDKRRQIFGIAVFGGLFEAIGPQHIANWLEQHGLEYLPWIARHFPCPYLDKAGRPVVPPITDWLFREHEDDSKAFEWFLMGCRSGPGALWIDQVNLVLKQQEMRPFLEHELRRVREWAKHVIEHEKQNAAFFRELDEDRERN